MNLFFRSYSFHFSVPTSLSCWCARHEGSWHSSWFSTGGSSKAQSFFRVNACCLRTHQHGSSSSSVLFWSSLDEGPACQIKLWWSVCLITVKNTSRRYDMRICLALRTTTTHVLVSIRSRSLVVVAKRSLIDLRRVASGALSPSDGCLSYLDSYLNISSLFFILFRAYCSRF